MLDRINIALCFCSEKQPQKLNDRTRMCQGHCGDLAMLRVVVPLHLLHKGGEGWNVGRAENLH